MEFALGIIRRAVRANPQEFQTLVTSKWLERLLVFIHNLWLLFLARNVWCRQMFQLTSFLLSLHVETYIHLFYLHRYLTWKRHFCKQKRSLSYWQKNTKRRVILLRKHCMFITRRICNMLAFQAFHLLWIVNNTNRFFFIITCRRNEMNAVLLFL